jgi:hypothetical protein
MLSTCPTSIADGKPFCCVDAYRKRPYAGTHDARPTSNLALLAGRLNKKFWRERYYLKYGYACPFTRFEQTLESIQISQYVHQNDVYSSLSFRIAFRITLYLISLAFTSSLFLLKGRNSWSVNIRQ